MTHVGAICLFEFGGFSTKTWRIYQAAYIQRKGPYLDLSDF